MLVGLGVMTLVHAAEPGVIPRPKLVEATEGTFAVTKETAIRFDPRLQKEAELFGEELGKWRGEEVRQVREELRILLPSEIRLDMDERLPLGSGGYVLKVTDRGISVVGKDAAGAWYGTRSLVQMLPPKFPEGGRVALDGVTVTDEPRFGWRGMMLDVGRHAFEVEDLKGFIDWLAFHKMNVFHWHLSEDQGWRVEIKKYPKLTEVGSERASTPPYGDRDSDDGKPYRAFYTQEQIRELVAYAEERHVTIVPEIDMPGHMAAAIAAYPELGNSDLPGYAPKVQTRWGVHPYTLAPTEETFRFVDDVLTEICDLFPSTYIHIGGDEAPKTQWEASPRVREMMKKEGWKDGHEVQSYFIKRVEKMLEAKGRKLIGWDEIREGGLSPKATVMSWRGEAGGIASAKEGHDVVMASNTHLYFDHYQRPATSELAKGVEFEAIGGFQPIGNVYSYQPVPKALSAMEAKHVLGVQAQLWTEYMKTWEKVEYMAFPRIAALAEVAWTPTERKDYADFRKRLDGVMAHYDARGVNRAEPLDPPKRQTADGSKVETSLGIYQDHWPELAFDGKEDTFFWADRALREGDTLSVTFAVPRAGRVKVVTGGKASQNGDRLAAGVLEAKGKDGEWRKVAEFRDGVAEGELSEGTAAIRLRVTGGQNEWLIVHEIQVR